jgi:hypothetical protein
VITTDAYEWECNFARRVENYVDEVQEILTRKSYRMFIPNNIWLQFTTGRG